MLISLSRVDADSWVVSICCWSGLFPEIALSKSLIEIGLLVLVTNGLISSRSGTRNEVAVVVMTSGGALVLLVGCGMGLEVVLFLFLFNSDLGCFFLQNASRSSILAILSFSLRVPVFDVCFLEVGYI